MEFGRVADVSGVDFTLPEDDDATGRVLSAAVRDPDGEPGAKTPAPPDATDATDGVQLGLAGWSDRDFIGRLYPRGTASGDFLRHYGRVFPTNELNSTYYGATAERITRWGAAVPEHFRFCPKLPATITHERELRDVDLEMEAFTGALAGLGSRIGRVWGTLAPSVGPEQLSTIEAFLRRWSPHWPLALELRHPAWFADAAAGRAIFDCFEELGVVAILTDVAGRRDVLHMRLTAPEVMLRFVGNRPHPSDRERVDDWVDRIVGWREQGLRRARLFFHQKQDPDAVELAEHFARRYRERRGVELLPGLDAARRSLEPRQAELF